MPSGSAPAPPPCAHPALRLGLFYAATFAVLGIYLPFWPVWLQSRGCDNVADVMIGQILARTLAGPWLSQRVDRSGRSQSTIVLLSIASLLALFPFLLAGSFWALFGCSFLFGLCYPPMQPILDNLTLLTARQRGFDYGRVRLWGSLSFLSVNVLGGAMLGAMPFVGGRSSGLPTNVGAVFWWLAAALASTALLALSLPGDAPAARPPLRSAIAVLLRDRRFLLFLAAVGLLQGSHAAYYSFASLRWLHAGIAPIGIGALWAEGVLAEVMLFFVMRPLVDRWQPTTLLLVGAAGAVVRWLCLFATTSLPLLFAVNWLHALSFAAVHIGSLQYLYRSVPGERMATAQGLVAAANSGVFLILGSKIAGWLYDGGNGVPFAAMAAMAAVGGGLCSRLRRS